MRRAAARGRVLPLLATVLVLAACGSPAPPGETGAPGPSGSPPSGATPSGSAPSGSTPSGSTPSGPTPSPGPTSGTGSAPAGEPARPAAIPQPVWDAVLADLATRTGGPPTSVRVVRAEAVTWNDGSLGCPEPGMVYTQALVDGYHVVLDVGGQEYDYRVGSRAAVKLCTSAQTP